MPGEQPCEVPSAAQAVRPAILPGWHSGADTLLKVTDCHEGPGP